MSSLGNRLALRMPTLFVGHGSPMNALANSSYTRSLADLGSRLPTPKAILVISAHWETHGTRVLKSQSPKTIHDFYGFPQELFDIRYPAPGSIETSEKVAQLLASRGVQADGDWGLDHGTWSVLKHIYPLANIPVLQLSLNRQLDLAGHLELASELRPLRDEGVLILGSGNITHNLRHVDWTPAAQPMAWAMEFDEMIKAALEKNDLETLLARDPSKQALWRQSLPSLEHYLPLLYAVGASDTKDVLSFPYEEMQMGSLSMRSVQYGVV